MQANTQSLPRHAIALLPVALLLGACEPPGDACAEAIAHVNDCVRLPAGLERPACSVQAATKASRVLGMSCEQIRQAVGDEAANPCAWHDGEALLACVAFDPLSTQYDAGPYRSGTACGEGPELAMIPGSPTVSYRCDARDRCADPLARRCEVAVPPTDAR